MKNGSGELHRRRRRTLLLCKWQRATSFFSYTTACELLKKKAPIFTLRDIAPHVVIMAKESRTI